MAGTDVLNQPAIDALLNAASEPAPAVAAPPTQIFSRARRDRDKVEICPYDFKRPERISKDQMRALEMLHETFARNFGASLSGFLRTIVEVRVSNATQMTYQEFISGLPNPTSFNLVRCPPLEGQICLEVSPLVLYPIIDRLLGGSNKELFVPQRPMTLIETKLLQKILVRGMAADGTGVLVVTSDVEEAALLADRLLVIRDGALTGELRGAAVTQEAALRLATEEEAT